MQSKYRVITLLHFIPPSIVLLIYSYVGTFSRFMADDFCSINDAHRYKMLRYIWHWFNNWGGRYSAIASDELLVHIGPIGVRYMPFFVLLIWIIFATFTTFVLLQKNIFKNITPTLASALSILVIYVLVSLSPDVQTVFYWWNGMRTYIPPLIFSAFHVSLIYWVLDRPYIHRHAFLITFISFSTALFTGGFNETFTTVQVLFFLTALGTLLITKKIHHTDTLFKLLFAALIGSIMALTIMAISPGAARRQTFFGPRPDIISMLQIAVSGYSQYIFTIVSSIRRITALISMVLAFCWIGSISEKRPTDHITALMWVFGGLLLSFAALMPSVYGLGRLPAPRTFIVPTYILVVSFAGNGIILGKWIGNRNSFGRSRHSETILLICTLGLILFSTWVNAKDIVENRHTYIEYAQLWDDVDANIKQAKLNGEESITIPNMRGWANLDRPNENPKFWPTACYIEFYEFPIYGPPYVQENDQINDGNNR